MDFQNTAAAAFNSTLGEFILPHDAVRESDNPEAALLAFLQSTYNVAARLAAWDCPSLECEMGVPKRPRPL